MQISYKKFSGYDAFKYRNGFLLLSNMKLLEKTILTCAWSPIVWKDGIANTKNFLYADFLALDFDTPGDETLETLNHSLQDHKRIIATTRSHQLPKNNITCDRYRLIIPFTERITDYQIYRNTYTEALRKFHWADRSCLDGARFFFPSKNIFIADRQSEYKWEISKTSPNMLTSLTGVIEKTEINGRIPLWCLDFINHGVVMCGSRNLKVYAVAKELFRQGFAEKDVRRLVLRAPINWDGIGIESILKSARSKAHE